MKARQLRTFVEEFLTAQGSVCERRGEGLLAVRVPKKLVPSVGARELVLSFTLQGLQEDPHSELATVGNPVFDRVLELARSSGRAAERFEPVEKKRRAAPSPESHYRFLGPGIKVGEPKAVYTPLYYFLYRIEYSLEELSDELEVVPVDAVSLQTLAQMPEVVEHWSNLETEPASGRPPLPAFPVPERTIRASLRLLERRLRKRLGRIRKDSEGHLVRETESIGNYYRQLIEETRNAGRRWTLPPGGREERIRLLQLDWKRRAEEAQHAWSPHLDVHLSSVAATQQPRIAFEVGLETARPASKRPRAGAASSAERSRPPAIYWDEAGQSFVDPPCVRCGTPNLTELRPGEGGFLCGRCWRSVSEDGGTGR